MPLTPDERLMTAEAMYAHDEARRSEMRAPVRHPYIGRPSAVGERRIGQHLGLCPECGCIWFVDESTRGLRCNDDDVELVRATVEIEADEKLRWRFVGLTAAAESAPVPGRR